METFWRGLLRINARYLALGAAILLVLSMLGWLVSWWPERAGPGTSTSTPPETVDAGSTRHATDVLPPASEQRGSPFESEHLSELVALSDEGLLRWDDPRSGARAPKPAPPPDPAPEPPAEARKVHLIYRGMFTRTDGTTVALIEDADSGRLTSHIEGAALNGGRISEITRDHMVMSVGEKSFNLRRGQRTELEY